ncbi:hypothetical protein Acr_07g0008760 [Actinidia rufa]|uniref:Uncharacterized protein n=1 Tax=Actinidia rufa TaxID=165716 RepID=A0A7J0EXL4_9ERIC|nr:hypothetical protein Acr_07g0008760 [Actinidia rufa]
MREATGRNHHPGSQSTETQQILRDLPADRCPFLPSMDQERQERDHRGYDRGPVHPHSPQSMRMRAVKMKPMP